MPAETATPEPIEPTLVEPAPLPPAKAPEEPAQLPVAPVLALSPRTPPEQATGVIARVAGSGEAPRGAIEAIQAARGNQFAARMVEAIRSKADESQEAAAPAREAPQTDAASTQKATVENTPSPIRPRSGAVTSPVAESASQQPTTDTAGAEPTSSGTSTTARSTTATPTAEPTVGSDQKTTEKGPAAPETPGKGGVAGKDAEEGGGEEPVAEEKGAEGTAAKLRRLGAVAFDKAAGRIKTLARRQKAHKPAGDKVTEAGQAVVPPPEEAQSRSNAGQVAVVAGRQDPQTNEASVRTTMDAAVESATPKTLEQVADFKESGRAQNVRAAVFDNVRGQTTAVQATYADVGKAPAAKKPPGEAPPIPEPETATPTGAMQLGKDIVPAVPAEDLNMKHYEEGVDNQMKEEGIDQATLDQVDSGPLAEANAHKAELKKQVEEGPKEIRAQEAVETREMNETLAGDEKQERSRMGSTRKRELDASKQKQDKAKTKEELERERITAEINRIYNAAKNSVEEKLKNLETNALKTFDDGQKTATDRFEARVKREMSAFKEERYSGLRGKARWVWDKLAGLEDNPRVLKIFNDAKEAFTGEIDRLIASIMAETKKVIGECRDEIRNAQTEIDNYVKSLKPSQQKLVETVTKEITEKLKALEQTVAAKEKDLQEKLAQRREKAIQAINERIEQMKESLKGLAGKLAGLLLDALKKLFKWALEKVGAPVEKIMGSLQRAGSSFKTIIRDPVGFLGNLLSAIGRGFNQFAKNIVDHLKAGFMAWLFGAAAKMGITIPREFSLSAIFGLVMQILGISVDKIKKKVAKYIGEENVERIEEAMKVIYTFVTKGAEGVWEMIKEYLTNLKEMVVDAIQDWLITQIIKQAVIWIISLFNPVAAIIKAIIAIYKVVMFIIDNIQKILEVFEAILGSLAEIASGAIGKAADWIEKSLANLVPVVIGFLASLLGISGITDKVREVIEKLQSKVDSALDFAIAKVAAGIKAVVTKVGKFIGKSKEPERKPDPAKSSDDQKREERKEAAAGIVEGALEKGIRRSELQTLLVDLQKQYELKSVVLTQDDDVVITNSNPRKVQGMRVSDPDEDGKRQKVEKGGELVGKFSCTAPSRDTVRGVIEKHIDDEDGFPYPDMPATAERPTMAQGELYGHVSGIQRDSDAPGLKNVNEFGNLERQLRGERVSGYESGHLIANQFGGPDDFRNLVPQLGQTMNRGVYRDVEKWVLSLLPDLDEGEKKKQFGTVTMKVKPTYGAPIDLTVAEAAAAIKRRLGRRYWSATTSIAKAEQKLADSKPGSKEHESAQRYLDISEGRAANTQSQQALAREYFDDAGANAKLSIPARIPISTQVVVTFSAQVEDKTITPARGDAKPSLESSENKNATLQVKDPVIVKQGKAVGKGSVAGGTKKVEASQTFVITEQ